MKRIVIIGSGNLAEQLALSLRQGGAGLVQLFARNRARCEAIGRLCGVPTATQKEELAEADIYLVAVSDRAVGEVTRPLNIRPEAIVAHTAGSVPIEALPHLRRGSFYPFQSFTAGRRIDLRKAPLFVEGSAPEVEQELLTLARCITEHVHRADFTARRRIHLAGVFACNFVNALYGVGEELMQRAGFGFEELKPLIEETARKACESQSPSKVQTGPAVRGDRAVLESHLKLLGELYDEEPSKAEELRRIYNELSDRIWETSKKTL